MDQPKALNEWLQGPAFHPPPGKATDSVNPLSLQKYDVLCQILCLIVIMLLILVRAYSESEITRMG